MSFHTLSPCPHCGCQSCIATPVARLYHLDYLRGLSGKIICDKPMVLTLFLDREKLNIDQVIQNPSEQFLFSIECPLCGAIVEQRLSYQQLRDSCVI
ncbi:MAG: hypothetical protein E7139_09000 [Rikenellaceae bacterium]|nr:hypothetical protein [Rikenellaceae bacterium]